MDVYYFECKNISYECLNSVNEKLQDQTVGVFLPIIRAYLSPQIKGMNCVVSIYDISQPTST